MGHQPVEDGVPAVQPVHPAVLGGWETDVHGLQQINDTIVLVVQNREGDSDLSVLRAGLLLTSAFIIISNTFFLQNKRAGIFQ